MSGRFAIVVLCIVLPVLPRGVASPRYTGTPVTQVFTERDLIVSAQVRSVCAHPNGLVYVATADGLLEYDGVSWRIVGGTHGKIVHQVTADRAGRLWYAASDEFGRLVPDATGFLAAQPLHTKLPSADRAVGHVLRMLVHDEHAYFVTQGARGVVARATPAGEVQVLAPPAGERAVALFAHQGKLHVTTAAAVYRLDGDILQAADDARAVRALGPLSVWPRAEGEDWVVARDGLHVWRPGGVSRLSADVATLLGDDRVSGGCPLADGTFALATEKHGVLIVGADGGVLTRYDNDQVFGAASSNIVHVAADEEGGLWVSRFGGVTRVQALTPSAKHDGVGAVRGRVQGFALHRGQLHVATTQGVFARDPVSGRFREKSGSSGDTWVLLSLEDGLLVGGPDLRLIRDDGTVEIVEQERLLFRSAVRLRRDPDRIVACTGPGLVRVYRRSEGRWRFEAGLPNIRASLYPIFEDNAGWLWATRSRDEVVRIDWRAGVRFDASLETVGQAHGLPFNRADRSKVTICVLDGAIEVCSLAGPWRHVPERDRFEPENRFAGFDPQRWPWVFALNDGDVWLAAAGGTDANALARKTTPGAWRVEPLAYTGLGSVVPLEVCDDPGTNTVWIGYLGLMSFDRAWRGPAPVPPRAQVRRVRAGSGSDLWGGAGPALTPVLAPENRTVRFDFSGSTNRPDAYGRTETQFRTQLVGAERAWSPWSDNPEREYSNLLPGTFSFHVQARDAAGRAGPVTHFDFTLLPPWWRTWWFIGLASVSAIGAIAGVTRWLSQRLLKRRVALLEAQSAVERERLRLARDLHDEVGSGLGRVILFAEEAERERADPAQLTESLGRVRSSAQELVQHAREIVWAVSPQNDSLASVIERLADYVDETLRAAGIACTLDLPKPGAIPPLTFGSEARHGLFLAVKEAVHNCVKYSAAKTAEFRLAIAGDDFVVTLRDHGRGFVAGEIRGTGHGHVSIVARAQALGGSAEITSAPGAGTTVALRIPLVRA